MKKLKKIYSLAVYDSYRFWGLAVLSIIVSYLLMGMSVLFGDLITLVSEGKKFDEMTGMLIITAGTAVLYSITFWIDDYSSTNFLSKNIFELRNRYIDKLLATKHSILSVDDSARYINNLTADARSIVMIYSDYGMYFFTRLFTIIGAFGAVMMIDWRVGLGMVGFSLSMGLIPLLIQKPLDKSIDAISKTNEGYLRSLKENLLGLTVIKNNNAEKECGQIIKEVNTLDYNANKKKNFINSIAGGVGVSTKMFATLGLIILTCYFVSTDDIKVGSVLSIYALGTTFFNSLLSIAWIITQLVSMKSVRERVEEVIDRNTDDSSDLLQLKSEISLNNISFKYDMNEERLILDDVSLTIKDKCKYLIIGSSGSGKSTILKLMCKFYDSYNGTINFDGDSYENYSEKEINSAIAYCQQTGYLFNRSLKDNIDFKMTNDTDKLHKIMKLVMLDDFVAKLPNGLDSLVDEEINQVSGGEKLRINLARSLFRDSDILLLDEITSALDKKTSEIIEHNILKLDKTIVNVCHKFNDKTLVQYDKIIIMENGKIILEGTYDELADNELLLSYRNIK